MAFNRIIGLAFAAGVAFLPASGRSAAISTLKVQSVTVTPAARVQLPLTKADGSPTSSNVRLLKIAADESGMTSAQLVGRWDKVIASASHRFGVPESWIRSVMMAESGGRTISDDGRPVISAKGAMGLMQMMPQTYPEMRSPYGLGSDPFYAHDNIFAGAAYLRWLQGKYGYPALFAAYNAGPGTLDDHLANGRNLPLETIAYVAKIYGTSAGGKQKPVTLTKPDGVQVAVDPGTVDSIRAALPDEFAPSVKSVLKMGNRMQGVREDIPTVLALLHRKASNA